jgi:hypothetical protein
MRVIYTQKNVEKVWGARYTLGARYLSKNTVIAASSLLIHLNKRTFQMLSSRRLMAGR